LVISADKKYEWLKVIDRGEMVAPMLVSVCLPTYNGRQFVEQAIESVLAQSHENFQLLVADDASQDDTFEVVARLAEHNNKIICWRNEKRLGLFANYNACLKRAQGELIKPFAQDDLLNVDCLERMVKAFSENKGVALVCVDRENGDLYRARQTDSVEETLPAGRVTGKQARQACLRTFRNLIGEPVTVMFGAEFKDLLFDETYYSLGDLDYWLRILSAGDLFHISEKLVTFRQHQDSETVSRMKNMDWVLDFFRLSKQYEDTLKEIGLTREQFLMRFSELAGELIDQLVAAGKLNMEDLDGFREVAFYSMRHCGQLAFKGREYDSVKASTSWRITEPLRFIMRHLAHKR
jgi:glycosyltransferase involved in cell wall biosynthesis